MRFAPKSAKELAEEGLLPAGDYDFEVYDAIDKLSKNGNDMIELQLSVFSDDGNKRRVTDYLVDSPKAAYKIRNFCEAVGMMDEYEAGELSPVAMLNRTGSVTIKIQAGGDYPDKNAVVKYLVDGPARSTATAPRNYGIPEKREPARELIDDDIPF